ncbi:hypothetical protein [Pedobacter jejuensis]|uniref:hypothetical protein n=1 Tax=Pedobacter jejuensis TaxID=1268550 RepID=UPI00142D25BD|nr:hypothetical protein [Pedobacter jejuensis]
MEETVVRDFRITAEKWILIDEILPSHKGFLFVVEKYVNSRIIWQSQNTLIT